ncbi:MULTISPECIES: dienelactone hydrolase family protein [unclassified Streptomyces]|uniref:dienelactone hydrolase family protein n=1 Tax=unclassified Streptomyces TaxID=2593676 RepID=UPI001E362B67|nr:dienelactone hydrolase family protein [Streptomyces sp. CB02980]MCB8907273.1 dienelactone hydrolase family protein [Streptomyces sp. CB02980]
MATTTLRIPTPDGQADAFAAFPDDGRQHPGVLLYMDVFGPRPRLEEMARELAGHGYFVLVPHVYYREGPAPLIELPEHIGEEERPALFEQLMPFYLAHTTERVLIDADAYLSFLTDRPEVGDGPVAVVGYCLGGVLAMRTAAAHPDRVAAVAGFHPGALITDEADSPHLLAPKVTAEVHFGIAEGDMTPEEFGRLNEVLEAAGVRHGNEIYPGTEHGFTMADTSAYSPDGTQRHWDRLLPLLTRTLTS